MIDQLNYPALWKPRIETVESHGKTYRVFDDTFYAADTPDDVIRVLHQARRSEQRIRVHYGYTTQESAAEHPELHGEVGRDWLEENDVEGTVGRSMGPIKIPLVIRSSRSTGGPGILTDCIVKITTTGKGRRTLYRHSAYHVKGDVTLHAIDETYGEGEHTRRYRAEVRIAGETHARFADEAGARRWIARMGLTLKG